MPQPTLTSRITVAIDVWCEEVQTLTDVEVSLCREQQFVIARQRLLTCTAIVAEGTSFRADNRSDVHDKLIIKGRRSQDWLRE